VLNWSVPGSYELLVWSLFTRGRLLLLVPKYMSYVRLSPSGSLQVHERTTFTGTLVALSCGTGLLGTSGGVFEDGTPGVGGLHAHKRKKDTRMSEIRGFN